MEEIWIHFDPEKGQGKVAITVLSLIERVWWDKLKPVLSSVSDDISPNPEGRVYITGKSIRFYSDCDSLKFYDCVEMLTRMFGREREVMDYLATVTI